MTELLRKLPLLHKLCLAGLVAVMAAELGARAVDSRAGRDASFYLPPADVHLALVRTHPYMGYEFRPGAVKEGNIEGGGQHFRINSLGMRGPEMAPEKAPGVYRILCVGGSTTFGSGASEDHKTYPARLEHYLNERAPEGLRYEVGNCGVTGYTTAENLINLELRLVELDHDAILLYEGVNDARMIQTRGFEPDYAHYRRSWVVTEITPLDRWLLGHVRLYAWATRGRDPEKQLDALANPTFVPGWEELYLPDDAGAPAEGLAVFFRNLEHMVLIARAHGVEPVLSTLATCDEERRAEQDPGATLAAINARLPAFAAELGVPLVDVAGALDDRCELFDDWIHLGDEGSDAHGRAVADAAQAQGLFGLK
jgi:lysophospholipase L1-like esterase